MRTNPYILFALFAFCLLPHPTLQFAAEPQLKQRPSPKLVQRVVIDAGHGGKDAGSLGKSSMEKNIALSIALQLGAYIKENMPDVKVIYTRKDDTFLELFERAQIANEQKADVFISIHCNSAPPHRKHILGTETYIMGLHTAEENLEVAKRENQVILMEDNYKKNYAGYDPNSPEAHIMLSMYQNAYLSQSLILAENIENQFVTHLKRPSRGVKQAGFMVLRTTTMPGVLVETGFLSNSEDEAYLRSEKGQIYTASAIYRAFKAYKERVEGKKIQEPAPTNSAAGQSNGVSPSKTTNALSGIVFKVQLASSSTLLNTRTGNWLQVKDLECEEIDRLYKYVCGGSAKLDDAIALQRYWRQNGFSDAFVVAYQNGKRIPLATAKQLLGIQ